MIDIVGLIKIDETQPERVNYLIASIRSYAFLRGHCTFTLGLETPSVELLKKISDEAAAIDPDWKVLEMEDKGSYGQRYLTLLLHGKNQFVINFMEDQFMLLDDLVTMQRILAEMDVCCADVCKSSFFTIEQNSSRGIVSVFNNGIGKTFLNDATNHFHNQKRYGKRFYLGVNFITTMKFALKFWDRPSHASGRPHEYEIGSYLPEWEHRCLIPNIEIQAAIEDDHGEPATCMLKRQEQKWLKIWSEMLGTATVSFQPGIGKISEPHNEDDEKNVIKIRGGSADYSNPDVLKLNFEKFSVEMTKVGLLIYHMENASVPVSSEFENTWDAEEPFCIRIKFKSRGGSGMEFVHYPPDDLEGMFRFIGDGYRVFETFEKHQLPGPSEKNVSTEKPMYVSLHDSDFEDLINGKEVDKRFVRLFLSDAGSSRILEIAELAHKKYLWRSNGHVVRSSYLFENSMVMTFDDRLEQVPFLQGRYSEELFAEIKKNSNDKTELNGFGNDARLKYRQERQAEKNNL